MESKYKKVVGIRVDKKGRKHNIYNPKFVEKQSLKKYEKIMKNHKIFHQIREQIKKDMSSKDIRSLKTKEIAIILYLMIECGFRIGNKKYEKEYNSHGISTIQFKHVKFANGNLVIDFIGKKGVRNTSMCNNEYLNKYFKNKKRKSKIDDYVFTKATSDDVNDYLKKFDASITSKDLRTWTANLWFIEYALKEHKNGTKNIVKNAIDQTSQRLHNTPAICKKSYIDSKVVNMILNKLNK
jgi:DNA topoisomerase I